MSETQPSLSIVIPLYNAIGKVEGLLMRLAALVEQSRGMYEVILADDASTDATPLKLAGRFPNMRIVTNSYNRGYGANVMSGVEVARGEYLATLNSDIELEGNPFPPLIAALEADPRLFAAMPLVFNLDLNKVENLARIYCRRGLCWHTELPVEDRWSKEVRRLLKSSREFAPGLEASAAGIPPIPALLCGAAFVCRREVFQNLGGFDSRYRPFYWEDVDLGIRALRRWMYCATVPQVAVMHRHSETINKHYGARKWQALRINQIRFLQAHADLLSGRLDKELGSDSASGAPGLALREREHLRYERIWWALRALREYISGDRVLGKAYWTAAQGKRV